MDISKLVNFTTTCIKKTIKPSADMNILKGDLELFFSLFMTYSKGELTQQLEIANEVRNKLNEKINRIGSSRMRYQGIADTPAENNENMFDFMYDNSTSALSDRRTYHHKYATSLVLDFINTLIQYTNNETEYLDKLENTLWIVMCFIRATQLRINKMRGNENQEEELGSLVSPAAGGTRHRRKRKNKRKNKRTRKHKNILK
jgi:hypothetical protein